jgi:uncharacterized protein YggE
MYLSLFFIIGLDNTDINTAKKIYEIDTIMINASSGFAKIMLNNICGCTPLSFCLIASIFAIVSLIYLSHVNISVNAQTVFAQNIGSNPINSTLSVSGMATTKVKPDKIILSLGVETTNKTADEALSSNSKLMSKTLAALKAAGVRENETSTSSFSISPNYNYSQASRGILTGFTASNSVIIESNGINRTSKWIDTAISAGANNINSIDFTLSDKKQKAITNSLITQSIDNAKEKARIAASALGLKVIGVKSINFIEFSPPTIPQQQSFLAKAAPTSPNAASTPIIPGEQEIAQNIDIVFILGKQ